MFVRASKTGVCLQNVKAGRGHIIRWRSVVRRVFRIAPAGGGSTSRRDDATSGDQNRYKPRLVAAPVGYSGPKLLYLRTCYFKFRFYAMSLRLRFYSYHNIINDIILFISPSFPSVVGFTIPSAYVFMSNNNNYNNNKTICYYIYHEYCRIPQLGT